MDINSRWTDWYSHRPEADINISETLYRTYESYSRKHSDEPAIYISATRESYTHGELLRLINSASAGFSSMGIGENSEIGILLNGSIEDAVTLLALNKIGAVCKFIDFMKSIPSIKSSVDEANLDALIMDECFLPFEQMINEKSLPVIVANSKSAHNGSHFRDYAEFLSCSDSEDTPSVEYRNRKPSVIITSSGTTGEPKPIVHTDSSVNAAARKLLSLDYPITSGNVVLKMIPSHIGLGLILSLYAELISGALVAMISSTSTEAFAEIMISFTKDFPTFASEFGLGSNAKLNIVTAPIFARMLVNSPELTDMSFVGSILAGGSKMSETELDKLADVIKRKGGDIPVCNVYGQNELAAGPVTANCNGHNVNGSAGFPTVNTEILVVDPVSKKPVDYNTVGLILERSDSEFLCYEGFPEKTRDAWITLADGTRWFNSCDLGYMNEDGFLFITGRTTRVAIREDHKISLDEIEQKLRLISGVNDCATLVPEYGGSNERIVAFIKATSPDVISEIQSSISLHEYETPTEFVLVDSLPYKNHGKVDYQKLRTDYLSNSMN